MQEQIKTLFVHVLDLDTSPKEPVQKKMVRYYNYRGDDQLNTFQFQPQPMSFEVIDRKTFTEVLYPKNIYDMIDYFVQEFVKQEHPVRVCKNCGKYFSLSGRSDAEYCNRSIGDKGRTCRNVGSIKAWAGCFLRMERKGEGRKIQVLCWGEISLQEFTDWLKIP